MQETKQKEIREKWHIKSVNMARSVTDYSKVEEMIADFFLKEFNTLLSEDRAKTVEEIERMKVKPHKHIKDCKDYTDCKDFSNFERHHNRALDDIINLLNNRE